MTKTYTQTEILEHSRKYFNGDDLAARVWLNKYALKDSAGNIYELTPDDMHKRIARELARIEKNYTNPIEEDELFALLEGFKYIIPQGSPMAGIGNDYQIGSLSNCFVIGNEGDSDSYGGIMKIDEEQVQLMKRRGGVGHDLSHIRPAGSPVKNSALTSTGLVPFMERYSNSTREVAQDGRRGALMLSVSIKHPDSEKFIDAKLEEGKVTGANVSVKITDEFMQAVIDGTDFEQKYPINSSKPTYTKKIDAKKLWDKIVHNAWKSAEPGILFWDTVIKESVPDCYKDLGFKTVSTNPCIVGDTLIAVADGRNHVSIKQLAEEGKDIPVYCLDANGNLDIQIMRNPRITGYNKKIYKVTLENGHTQRVTGNHQFRLKDGNYVETTNLKPGDSLHIMTKWLAPVVYDEHKSKKDYMWLHDEIGIDDDMINIDPRLVKTYKQAFENGYNSIIENNEVLVEKICESCHEPYWINYFRREISFCSHKCSLQYVNSDKKIAEKRIESLNKTYEIIGEENKNKQLDAFTRLRYELGRNPLMKEWEQRCVELEISHRLKTKYGFENYSELKEEAEVYNHRIVSIEEDGIEDVYNGTVDKFHNFFTGGFKELTKSGKDKYVYINQLNCGEIPLCPYDSCRLLAINLYSYVKNPFQKDAEFDYELFTKHLGYAQRIMDDIIDLELEKIEKILAKIGTDPEEEEIKSREIKLWDNIKKKCIEGRRTGIGITAEGDMLAALGHRYGSEEATEFSVGLHKLITIEAYRASMNLAKERGVFPIYDAKREKNNPFIKRIAEADPSLYKEMEKHGRRNIALLTIAPTGSVSILTQTTSGIEPLFLISYKRRRKVNPNDKNVRVDFIDEVGDAWEEFNVFHSKFLIWLEANGYDSERIKLMKDSELASIIEKSPYYKATANDVDWVSKVKMQGKIQKWVDHSISVTVNVPTETKEEMIAEIYKTAWESGCKGVTVYREGSRSGVLVSNTKKDDKAIDRIIKSGNAPKRPEKLPCDVMRFQNNKEKWIGFVGLLPPPKGNNEPYEIFTGLLDSFQIPTYVEKGWIKKVKDENGGHSRYDFVYRDRDNIEQEMKALSRAFDREYWNYGKMISGVIRHGMPIPNVINLVDSLHMGDGDTIVSWKAGVKRMLKNYVKDTIEIGGMTCPECGGTMKSESGCASCLTCGFSKCS